jgi:serine/threonine-protein phosphatase 6 regulatory subunit 3
VSLTIPFAQWLHSEGLLDRLIDMLSPSYSSDIQQIASELLVAIISMATPSPGAAVTEQGHHGVASNLYAREIARPEYISRLVLLIFQDFSSERNPSLADDEDTELSRRDLPKFEYACSSTILAMHVVSELIRKNNSDYFEPFLFHTLRHRLTAVQQQQQQQGHVQGDSEECREALERAMKEMVDRMGVVNLNYLLDVLSDRMETLMRYLDSPRSWVRIDLISFSHFR